MKILHPLDRPLDPTLLVGKRPSRLLERGPQGPIGLLLGLDLVAWRVVWISRRKPGWNDGLWNMPG
jgi:hypothetical protein